MKSQPINGMLSASRGRRIFFILFAIFIAATALKAQTVTAIDENGIRYTITKADGTEAKVSNLNSSESKTTPQDVVIPKTFIDQSDAGGHKTFTVVGFEDKAFQNASWVRSLTVDADIPHLGTYSFDGCANLTSVTINGNVASLSNYTFRNCTSLATVGGDGFINNVTAINDFVFQGCTALQQINLPKNIATLGNSAFENCTALKAVTLPGTLTTIGSSTFSGCISLDEAIINEGITELSNSMFFGCTALAAPTFPSTLTKVGSLCFKKCTSLGDLLLYGGVSYGEHAYSETHLNSLTWPATAPVLGAGMFRNSTGLADVAIPGYIADIPAYLFCECSDLNSVTLSEGTKSIGSEAFSSCGNLTTLSLSPTLEVIMGSAFYRCTSLGDFDFPSSLRTVGAEAFRQCTSLKHISLPAGASLGNRVFYSTELLLITLPDEPMGSIGNEVFGTQNLIKEFTVKSWMTTTPSGMLKGWKGLENLVIEEGVEILCSTFVQDCSALATVTFPSTLKEIKSGAFQRTVNLASAILPEGLSAMGNEAFSGSGVQTVSIPASLVTIPERAFSSCRNLSSLTLAQGITLIDKLAFSSCTALTQISFPGSITDIGEMAFNASGLKEVTIPAGATIGRFAFGDSKLETIIFPETPCTFGPSVFYHNMPLTSVALPQWMTSVPERMFEACNNLESVILPPTLESIEASAFSGCKKLHDVEFPSTLASIGEQAFMGCGTAAGNPKIPFGTVTLYAHVKIGNNAFQSATVTEIIFKDCPESFGSDVFKNVSTIKEISFPDCFTEIPAGFCSGWSELTTVKIGANVTSIAENAFDGCRNLKYFTYTDLPEDEEELAKLQYTLTFPPTLTNIGKYAFRSTPFTSVEWPDDKVEIGEGAFYNNKFTALEIPRWLSPVPAKCFQESNFLVSLTWEPREGEYAAPLYVGDFAFEGCDLLPEINLPDVETTYGENVFRNNAKATAINWPAEAKQIFEGNSTFTFCNSLESVTVPDYVGSLPASCFYGCIKLSSLDMGNGLEACGASCFQGCALTSIKWSETIKTLGIQCFLGNRPLTSVTIPGTIKDVPEKCFFNCTALAGLEIGEGVATIGKNAFSHDNSESNQLTTVKMPSTLRSIGNSAFAFCKHLAEITLNEGLETINASAFQSCISLKEITLPSSLNADTSRLNEASRNPYSYYSSIVGDYAFKECSSLEKVVSHATNLTIGIGCFMGCSNLKSFVSDGHIFAIAGSAFKDVASLEDFICPDGESVNIIRSSAFEGCTSLKAFPYLRHTNLERGAFMGCSSLRQLTMQRAGWSGYKDGYAFGFNIAETDVLGRNFANNCTSLQSIVFPGTAPYFRLEGGDLANAPLKALSYCNATGIDIAQSTPTLMAYSNAGASARDEKPKLIVRRGQKWKFHEQGYNQLFDIIEQREPQVILDGFLKSEFLPDENRNLYTAVLRWEAPLSDLNPGGPTKVTVYRDNSPVSVVEFSQPRLETKDGRQVYAVDVTVNGESRGTELDFFYYSDMNGESEVYETQRISNGSTIYFDAESEKRLMALEKWGYVSWMAIRDQFKSPALDDPSQVPVSYDYHAVIDGYDYDVLVNNDNLVEGADGLLYHTEKRNSTEIKPQSLTMKTMMAVPTLDCETAYTTEQILNDTDFRLNVSDASKFNRIKYSMDRKFTLMKYKASGTTQLNSVVSRIDLYDVTDVAAASAAKSDIIVATAIPSAGHESGTLTIKKEANPAPGRRYQTIIHSPSHGDFGSPVIILPDVPSVTATLSVEVPQHMYDDPMSHLDATGTGHLPVTATLTIENIDATGMGHPAGLPARDFRELGVMRQIKTEAKPAARANSLPSTTKELVFHPTTDPDAVTNSFASRCDLCSQNDCPPTDTEEDGRKVIRMIDTYDIDGHLDHTVAYTPRVYVKIPSSLNPGEDRWLLAQTEVAGEKLTVTGLENVLAGEVTDQERVRYFDINGFEVSQPVEGTIYIKVSASGAEKIVY